MSTLRSLIWKEYREHRWKALSALAVMASPSAVVLKQYRGLEPEACWGIATFVGFAMAIWIAAGIITSDRRTQHLLEALPVSHWKVFAFKSLAGLATLLIPLTLVFFVSEFFVPPPMVVYLARYSVCCIIVLTHFYLLILAVAMSARREGMAAMAGVIVLLCTLIGEGLLSSWRISQEWSGVLFPFSLLSLQPPGSLPIVVVECLFLWLIAGWRYQRLGQSSAQMPAPAPANSATAPRLPRHTSLTISLIWKEWREQRGVLLGSAAAGVGMALVGSLASAGEAPLRLSHVLEGTTQLLTFLAVLLLPIVAVVLGISGWTSDIDADIESFWRSRPISPARFFWCKYAAAIAGLYLLAGFFLASSALGTKIFHATPLDANLELSFALGQSLFWSPLILTCTMLATLLFRRPLYAGVLSVGASIMLGATGLPIFFGAMMQLRAPFIAAGLVLMLTPTLGLAFLASRALEKNWRVA